MKRTVTTLRQLKEMIDQIPEEHLDLEVRAMPEDRGVHGERQGCPLANIKPLSVTNVQAFYNDTQRDHHETTDGVEDNDTYVYIYFEWTTF